MSAICANPREPQSEIYKHRKILNEASYSWAPALYVNRGSVIPSILAPLSILTAWAILWTCLYLLVPGFKVISIQSTLIQLVGTTLSLLLVFRTNTAYDRYNDGRKVWTTLQTQIRNLSRFVWICVLTDNQKQLQNKKSAINLLEAFAIATKHYLREEEGNQYAE